MAPAPRAAPEEMLTIRPHLTRPHHGQNGLRAQERRFQVHRDGAVEIVLGQIVDAAHDRDAGIVDENVDRAERGGGLFDHARNGRSLRDVGRDRDGAAAASLNLRDDRLRVFRPLAVIDRDRGAQFRERQRNRRTDAAGCARHQCDMRTQILPGHRRSSVAFTTARPRKTPYNAGSTASSYSFLNRAISSAAGKTLPMPPIP